MRVTERGLSWRRAVAFIVLLGAISLFADMTYEGARSITGPYLGSLGVTATTIGIVSGFGELIGYVVRLGSGYLADRSGRYWAVTILGYLLNLFAMPLLALAGNWQIAVVLMPSEWDGRSAHRGAMRCCRTPQGRPGSAGALACTRRSIRQVP